MFIYIDKNGILYSAKNSRGPLYTIDNDRKKLVDGGLLFINYRRGSSLDCVMYITEDNELYLTHFNGKKIKFGKLPDFFKIIDLNIWVKYPFVVIRNTSYTCIYDISGVMLYSMKGNYFYNDSFTNYILYSIYADHILINGKYRYNYMNNSYFYLWEDYFGILRDNILYIYTYQNILIYVNVFPINNNDTYSFRGGYIVRSFNGHLIVYSKWGDVIEEAICDKHHYFREYLVYNDKLYYFSEEI